MFMSVNIALRVTLFRQSPVTITEANEEKKKLFLRFVCIRQVTGVPEKFHAGVPTSDDASGRSVFLNPLIQTRSMQNLFSVFALSMSSIDACQGIFFSGSWLLSVRSEESDVIFSQRRRCFVDVDSDDMEVALQLLASPPKYHQSPDGPKLFSHKRPSPRSCHARLLVTCRSHPDQFRCTSSLSSNFAAASCWSCLVVFERTLQLLCRTQRPSDGSRRVCSPVAVGFLSGTRADHCRVHFSAEVLNFGMGVAVGSRHLTANLDVVRGSREAVPVSLMIFLVAHSRHRSNGTPPEWFLRRSAGGLADATVCRGCYSVGTLGTFFLALPCRTHALMTCHWPRQAPHARPVAHPPCRRKLGAINTELDEDDTGSKRSESVRCATEYESLFDESEGKQLRWKDGRFHKPQSLNAVADKGAKGQTLVGIFWPRWLMKRYNKEVVEEEIDTRARKASKGSQNQVATFVEPHVLSRMETRRCSGRRPSRASTRCLSQVGHDVGGCQGHSTCGRRKRDGQVWRRSCGIRCDKGSGRR